MRRGFIARINYHADQLMSSAPLAAVLDFEPSSPFASNHYLSMAIAQLDLSNRPAGCIDLPQNYRNSAIRASRYSARHRTSASPDLNGRRGGIEVGFEHRLVSRRL